MQVSAPEQCNKKMTYSSLPFTVTDQMTGQSRASAETEDVMCQLVRVIVIQRALTHVLNNGRIISEGKLNKRREEPVHYNLS
jgi:hypothetical protein